MEIERQTPGGKREKKTPRLVGLESRGTDRILFVQYFVRQRRREANVFSRPEKPYDERAARKM